MPLYRCTLRTQLTSTEQRQQMAREITRIHCEVTGALPGFVHAFFAEDEDGRLPADVQALVLGSIRAGRTPAQKEKLASEMRRALATIAGLPEPAVRVATVDLPARWVMEGGEILPEPGAEAEWLAAHGAGRSG